MRGEDSHGELTDNLREGSPPHARGRLDETGRLSTLFGITPACAGKTGPAYLAGVLVVGSPPHARGRRVR